MIGRKRRERGGEGFSKREGGKIIYDVGYVVLRYGLGSPRYSSVGTESSVLCQALISAVHYKRDWLHYRSAVAERTRRGRLAPTPTVPHC